MIEAVAARLEAQATSLATVRKIAELAQLTAGGDRNRLPAAYVHLRDDRALPNRLVNAVSQQLTREIGVLLIVASTGQDRTAGTPDLLEPLLAEVRAALIGWQPAGLDVDPLELAGGTLTGVGQGQALWLERYVTRTYLPTAIQGAP